MPQAWRSRCTSPSGVRCRPRKRSPEALELLAAHVAFADPVPELDPVFTELPAELDQLAIPVRRKVDESLERPFELDAQSVQSRHRFQQLELCAADRVTRLLVTVAMIVARAVA